MSTDVHRSGPGPTDHLHDQYRLVVKYRGWELSPERRSTLLHKIIINLLLLNVMEHKNKGLQPELHAAAYTCTGKVACQSHGHVSA